MTMDLKRYNDEIRLITESGTKNVFFKIEATVHADGRDIDAYYVTNLDMERNYIKRIFEVTTLDASIPEGTFQKYIVPFKNNLEITVRMIPVSENSVEPNTINAVQSLRFKATLYDGSSGSVEGNNPTLQNVNKANLGNLKSVRFQLTDPVVSQLRLKTVGGIYRNARTIDTIRTVLGRASQSIKNTDNVRAVNGIDVAPGAIEKVKQHVIIPHLMKLVDFPHFVHSHFGGVYTGGLNHFLQNGIWYVYPPFDITRYPKTQNTLTVLNVPAQRYPNPERSYRRTSTQTLILGTGEVKHVDMTESMKLNVGTGVRFADADKLFHSFVETGGNKAVAVRGNTTTEMVSEVREDGIVNAQAADTPITVNYGAEMSKLAERNGAYLQLEWQSAKPSLIYPGMPSKIIYLENNTVRELFGNLVGAHPVYQPTNVSAVEKRFTCNIALTFFVNSTISFPEPA